MSDQRIGRKIPQNPALSTDWSRYNVGEIWTALRLEDSPGGWDQERAWWRWAQLLDEQHRRLSAARDALARDWNPRPGSAAAAYFAEFDRLLQSMDQTRVAATRTANGYGAIVETLARARREVKELIDPLMKRRGLQGSIVGKVDMSEIRVRVQQIMTEADKAVADHGHRIIVPSEYLPPQSRRSVNIYDGNPKMTPTATVDHVRLSGPVAPVNLTQRSSVDQGTVGSTPSNVPVMQDFDPSYDSGPGLAGLGPLDSGFGGRGMSEFGPDGLPIGSGGRSGGSIGGVEYGSGQSANKFGGTTGLPAAGATASRVAGSGMMPMPMATPPNPQGRASGAEKKGPGDTQWEAEQGIAPVIEGEQYVPDPKTELDSDWETLDWDEDFDMPKVTIRRLKGDTQ